MAARTSGSFRRFLVTGLTPSPDDDSFFEKLREHRFRTIDDQPVADSSSGWVVADTFQSSDFRPETVFFGPVVRLRIRLDQKRLPTNSIRVRLAEAVSSIGGRIARSARTKLKDDIEKELLGRTVPSTNVFEVYWRPRDEILLLSSSSVGAHDTLVSLFRQTFGVAPTPATPTPLASFIGGTEIDAGKITRLAPIEIRT